MIERGRFLLLRSLVVFAFLVAINAPHYAYVAAQGDSVGERLTDYDIDSLPGTGNKSARGVCSDGTTLWVVEERALKLFAYSLEDDVPTRDEGDDIQLDFYENYLPGDCTSDGATIWVADNDAFKLVAYDVESGARASGKDFDELADGNDRFVAAANDTSTMWIADITDSHLYAYDLADGARDADRDIALHQTGLRPVGLWTDGVTMWVAENSNDFFFAYELATGDRDTDKEFAASDAPNVQGIWSNGRVMWAANRLDRSDQGNKVLAYRMPVSVSSDASLSALSLSGVTLAPAFASGTTAYTASVGHGVTETTVSATAAAGATYVVRVNGVEDVDGVMPLAVGGNVISVEVTAQDGVTKQTYTVTVTRAGSADASLSGLSLSGVTLAPVFASGTTAYTATVGYGVTETTVSATGTEGATYVVKMNGVVDQDGVVPLAVGNNVIALEVTAQDGVTTGTYTVTVTRAGSGDASLASLSLNGVTLAPVFVSGTTAYTATVGHGVRETTVSASAVEGATYVVKVNGVVDQDGVVPLVVGSNAISIEVTAQDGVTTGTYTVTVTRAGSGDASLASLSLSGVTLAPAFVSGTLAYTASVGNVVTETTVSATAAEGATYVVNVNGVEDMDGVMPLAVGGNVIAIEVTAQDGVSKGTYTVMVTRAASANASLSTLTLSGITLTPTFATGTTAYTATVGYGVTETTVSATAAEGATYVVKANGVVDQDGVVPLAVGSNVIAIEVTAQDGVTTGSYTVTVTRAGSADASLSGLSLSSVTLSPAFAVGTTTYAASVANAVTETTVSATAAAGATYVVKLEGALELDGIVPLVVGSNAILVEVTAQDGVTTGTYTVTVTRAASADASLSTLTLSGITLTPTFATGTSEYTASVGNAVTEATVSATAAAGATYVVKVNGVVDQDGVVPLVVGSNVISVEVTAQDGVTKQTYAVTVTRAGSGDASLASLSLSGVTLAPVFASGTTAYAALVGHAVTETTVSATAAAGATYGVKLNGVVDQDGIVPLVVGSSAISVEVTAQDGVTKQTYTVTVTRAGSGDASLASLSLSGVTLAPVFASGTMAYTASVGYGVTETTVSATAAAGATYVVKVNGTVDLDGIVPLAVGSNVIAVEVTAQDGVSKGKYTVTVTRAGSADASLSTLTLSGMTLVPAFVSGTLAYTASVGNVVTETTVSASAAAGATYVVKVNGVADRDGIVPLAVGSNVIAVEVTAQDGVTTGTYSVTVTREKSADASLSALSLSGVTLAPVFVSGTTAYTATVGYGVTETTVSATAAEGATYVVKVNGVEDMDGVLPLAVGGNVIGTEVTAQDGVTKQTYTVTVMRARQLQRLAQ